jgi:hypothetical protein
MLTALFFIPLIGALSLLFVNKNESLMKRITLGTTILNFFISLIIFFLGVYLYTSLDILHSFISFLFLVNTSNECNILIFSLIPLMTTSNNSKSLDPNFITGFTDAEGSFTILITESKTCKIGWTVRARFQIRLHSKDLPLLKEIQSFFGGIGNIYTSSKDQTATYRIEDIKSLTNVIVPHFESYSLQSAKRIDYELWKQCINLKEAEKSLTLSSLEKIIAIKGAINLGLSDKLINLFPLVKPITRPEFFVNKAKLNPHWISGFTTGEGCFSFSINGDSIKPSFSIGLHKRDEPLLLKILEFFNSKANLYSYGAHTSVELKISAKSDFNTFLIPHFNKYPLSGVKLYNYIIWREMVELITNKAHLTPNGIAKLRELQSTLNKI